MYKFLIPRKRREEETEETEEAAFQFAVVGTFRFFCFFFYFFFQNLSQQKKPTNCVPVKGPDCLNRFKMLLQRRPRNVAVLKLRGSAGVCLQPFGAQKSITMFSMSVNF